MLIETMAIQMTNPHKSNEKKKFTTTHLSD